MSPGRHSMQIGQFVCQGKIGTELAQDWHGLAWIGTDWHGLTWIGTDWQIGKFVSEPKIDPGLAQDWQGLARIGKLANLCRNEKLAPDWHRIGMD